MAVVEPPLSFRFCLGRWVLIALTPTEASAVDCKSRRTKFGGCEAHFFPMMCLQAYADSLMIVPERVPGHPWDNCSATIMMAAYRQLDWPNRAVVE
jgi:hypothetical protein